MKTTTYFEIQHNDNGTIGKNSQYSFDTKEEALAEAIAFKNNPRSHNENMSDENVKYWKSQSYTIVGKTINTEVYETI